MNERPIEYTRQINAQWSHDRQAWIDDWTGQPVLVLPRGSDEKEHVPFQKARRRKKKRNRR